MGLILVSVGCGNDANDANDANEQNEQTSKDPKNAKDGAVETLAELADVLGGLKTKADAEGVQGKVGALLDKFMGYSKQVKAGGISDETKAEMTTRTAESMAKILAAMQNLEIANVLRAEFAKLQK